MMGAGGRNHRLELETRASDVLPTAGVVLDAKLTAAKVVSAWAAEAAWPDVEAAKARVALIPFVALAALLSACPDVRPERLARCLGLDPLEGPDELVRLCAEPVWPAFLVVVVLDTLGAQR